jgi:hypothetical protein
VDTFFKKVNGRSKEEYAKDGSSRQEIMEKVRDI